MRYRDRSSRCCIAAAFYLNRSMWWPEEAKRGAERTLQQAAMRRLYELQRVLGIGQHAARARDMGWGLGISR